MRGKEMTKSIVYLTFIDQYSPVYNSQVIEQCNSLKNMGYNIKIYAFLPLSNYLQGAKQIKTRFPSSKTLPIITRLFKRRWFQLIIARFIIGTVNANTIITRSLYSAPVLAIVKALQPKLKIIYDIRGAAPEEALEYGDDKTDAQLLNTYEKLMLQNSDKQIIVSNALRLHLQTKHKKKLNSTVIPCCIKSSYIRTHISILEATNKRTILYSKFKTLYIYSGSLTAWNFSNNFLLAINSIANNPENGVIILSHEKDKLEAVFNLKKSNIFIKTLAQEDISSELAMCDYGILLRDANITNQVASPSKFAEYLGSGLSIIISDDLGDYSDFVRSNNCGFIFGQTDINNLPPISIEQRIKNTNLAQQHFTRESVSITNAYHKLLK